MLSAWRNRLIGLIVIVLLLVVGVFLWKTHNAALSQKDDLIRQLQGNLTEKEKQFEAANNALGMAQSKIVDVTTLKKQYDDLQASIGKDKANGLNQFQKKNKAHVDAITTANIGLSETTTHSGTSKVTESETPAQNQNSSNSGKDSGESPNGAASHDSQKVITYEFWDEYHRFHLIDPNIMLQGNKTFTLNQQFQLTSVVLKQDHGNLKAQQIVMNEVTSDGHNGWKVIGQAKVTDAHFSYAPDDAVNPAGQIFDPHLIAQVGLTSNTSIPVKLALEFGVGATLLQWYGLGLQATGYTDFKSLEGTGVAAAIYYRPSLKGQAFNFAISAGAGLGLDLNVHPMIGIDFIIW